MMIEWFIGVVIGLAIGLTIGILLQKSPDFVTQKTRIL